MDAGLDVVMQKTGATGEEAAALGDAFSTRWQRRFRASLQTRARLWAKSTHVWGSRGCLWDASEAFLKYARLNGTDVNTSVQLVTRAMGDAGIAAEDYGSVLDSLTVAGKKSGISVDTFGDQSRKVARANAPTGT